MTGVALAVLGAWAALNLLRVDYQGWLQVGVGGWGGNSMCVHACVRTCLWVGVWVWADGGYVSMYIHTHTLIHQPTNTPSSTPNPQQHKPNQNTQNFGALWQMLTTLAIVVAVLVSPSPEHRSSARDVFKDLHNESGFPDRCVLRFLRLLREGGCYSRYWYWQYNGT